MAGQILTVVSAAVDPAREDDLAAAYQAVLAENLPDGLLASALLRGDDNQWQIATLWRDRAALAAMRAAPEPPAAPRVFRQVGAEPTLAVFEVANAIQRLG
jgi:heme-degrading monooxygenase HmoA